MRRLIEFLVKYNYWFVFFVLELICVILFIQFNNYQQSVYFTSANRVVGEVYNFTGGMEHYFGLKESNEELLARNLYLEQEVNMYKSIIKTLQGDSIPLPEQLNNSQTEYTTIKGDVINNSVSRKNNFITINKGSEDGVGAEMGIIDRNGVVGIIYLVSAHFSIGNSLLSSNSNLSCMVKQSNHFGSLVWDRGDSRYAFLKDISSHANISVGDTITTSGNTPAFPRGIMVGKVSQISDSQDGFTYVIKVELSADFGRLSDVRIVYRKNQQEVIALEKKLKYD